MRSLEALRLRPAALRERSDSVSIHRAQSTTPPPGALLGRLSGTRERRVAPLPIGLARPFRASFLTESLPSTVMLEPMLRDQLVNDLP